jgi:autotransporter-associated beta strand protein
LVGSLLLLAGASSLKAGSGTWTNTASGGLWSATGNWLGGAVADGTGNTADFSTIDITANNTVHLDASHTLSILKFGNTAISPAANWLLDNNGTAGNILTLGTTPTITVNSLGAGQQTTISAVVAGTAGLTKTGAGTLDLSGADTLTGGLTINGGTLALDFTTGTTTVLGSQALALGGGTLNIPGCQSRTEQPDFGRSDLSRELILFPLRRLPGAAIPPCAGRASHTTGATVQFVGPATTNSLTSSTVAATATITTTTAGTGTLGLICSGAGTAYATVGLYDWASTDTTGGSAGTTIIGGSQVSGFYTTPRAAAVPASIGM